MKRKETEKTNFPYNMLKAFNLERDSYPEDIYDTVLAVMISADKSENKKCYGMTYQYFKRGSSYQQVGDVFGVSSETAKRLIGNLGKAMHKKIYLEQLAKGMKRYAEEHDGKPIDVSVPVSDMCISEKAEEFLTKIHLRTAQKVITMDKEQLRKLHFVDDKGKNRNMTNTLYYEIVQELTEHFGADKQSYQLDEKTEPLPYPNNFIDEIGNGRIKKEILNWLRNQLSEHCKEEFDSMLRSADWREDMRNYHFVLLRYQEKHTFQAIADRYGVTKGLVRSTVACKMP